MAMIIINTDLGCYTSVRMQRARHESAGHVL